MPNNTTTGKKQSQGKIRWSLMPWEELEQVAKVVDMGATKYEPDDWRKNKDKRKLYEDALLRHTVAYMQGEKIDQESGLSHLAHVAVNCLFLMNFDKKSGKNGRCT